MLTSLGLNIYFTVTSTVKKRALSLAQAMDSVERAATPPYQSSTIAANRPYQGTLSHTARTTQTRITGSRELSLQVHTLTHNASGREPPTKRHVGRGRDADLAKLPELRRSADVAATCNYDHL